MSGTRGNDLESACRLAFGAYVFLQARAAALAPRSATARLLAEPGPTAAGAALARAREELEELRGVLAGTHGDPLVLEASQVWYWCCVSALLSGLSYDDFSPHRAWEEVRLRGSAAGGSEAPDQRTPTPSPGGGRTDGGDAPEPESRRILAEAGEALAGRLEALEAVRYDLAQLREKDYLAPYFAARP